MQDLWLLSCNKLCVGACGQSTKIHREKVVNAEERILLEWGTSKGSSDQEFFLMSFLYSVHDFLCMIITLWQQNIPKGSNSKKNKIADMTSSKNKTAKRLFNATSSLLRQIRQGNTRFEKIHSFTQSEKIHSFNVVILQNYRKKCHP